MIVYSKYGITFIPKCVQINEFTIKNTSECKSGIPVEFELNNELKKGYLIDSKIILTDADKRNCENKKVILINSSSLIVDDGNEISIKNNVHTVKLKVMDDTIKNLNFPHYKTLLTDIQIYNEIERESVKEYHSSSYKIEQINSKNSVIEEITEIYNSIRDFVFDFVFKFKFYVITIACVIGVIIILIIIIKMICMCVSHNRKKKRYYNRRNRIMNEIYAGSDMSGDYVVLR